MHFVFLSLMWSCAVAQILPVDPNTPGVSCELMTNLTFCNGIGYTMASFPNFRMQTNQGDANTELKQFIILVNLGCSNALVHYLCSVYAPYCHSNYLKIPPCANLCVYVRDSCAPRLQQYGISWPPQLACESWPAFGAVCFGPSTEGLSNLTIPRNPLFTLPNTTSVPVTSSATNASGYWNMTSSLRPTPSRTAASGYVGVSPSDTAIQSQPTTILSKNGHNCSDVDLKSSPSSSFSKTPAFSILFLTSVVSYCVMYKLN